MSSPLQNKLFNYEVQPPGEVWSKIAASLEETISSEVSEKLYHFEEAPSPAIWPKIASQLDIPSREKARVLPFYTRYRRPLKYASVAAIFIFLAILTSLLISKKTESELPGDNLVSNQNTREEDTVKAPSDSKETGPVSPIIEKTHPEVSVARSKVARAKKYSSGNSISLAENLFPTQVERTSMIGSSFNADKYMIYSDGDGNAVRLPKKIFSAFACPADNTDCKQRLQKLREKFAESAVTADFTGLLQILKSLQENQ